MPLQFSFTRFQFVSQSTLQSKLSQTLDTAAASVLLAKVVFVLSGCAIDRFLPSLPLCNLLKFFSLICGKRTMHFFDLCEFDLKFIF